MSVRFAGLLVVLTLLAVTLAACSGAPLPPPAAQTATSVAPTQPPTTVDDDWARVQAAGVLQVGSPLDNPPFNTYNAQWQPDGFDVALMTELANRLGLKVEFKDIVFDSLLDTLELGRIDAAIAAMAVTKERQQVADFTSAYYQGEDIVLAAPNSPIAPVTDSSGLAGHTIGVVRGTVYESWLNRNMRAGTIDIANLRSFSRPEDVINALETGRVDLAVLDREPGLTFVSQGRAKEVGKSTYIQDFAIALRQGSTLAPKLNTELAKLMADGTVRRLAEIYLSLPPDKYTPVPPATAEPQPTAPATPQPTATPAPIDDLTAGKDVDLTIPDNTQMKPGQAFRKGWRLTNSGTTTWSPQYRVVYANGIPDDPATQMGGLPTEIGTSVAPKGKVDVYVDMVAPKEPGTYKAFWQMENASGQPFGDQFWVQIVVPSPATPTPKPAPTAQPGLSYSVNPPTVQLGASTTISWNITGVVKSVYFCTQPSIGCEGVGQVDKRQRTPTTMPVTYYELQIQQTNGQWLVQPIPVNVTQPPAGPTITGFSATAAGDCADLWWQVSDTPRRVAIARIGMRDPAEDGSAATGSKRDCPGVSGQLTYELQVWAQGSTNDQPPIDTEQRTVTLQGPQPQVVERFQNDCGAGVNLRPGDMFIVHLKASSGTGYVWEQTDVNPAVLALQGAPEVQPGGEPGAEDEYTWRYQAGGGQTRVSYALRQSWDTSAAPAQTCYFDVTVQ